jgi:hypothetical protein
MCYETIKIYFYFLHTYIRKINILKIIGRTKSITVSTIIYREKTNPFHALLNNIRQLRLSLEVPKNAPGDTAAIE